MAGIAFSEAARKIHGPLLDLVLPMLAEGSARQAVSLLDRDEISDINRSGPGVISLGRTGSAVLSLENGRIALNYDGADLECAAAALGAALAGSGCPVAGDAASHALLALALRLSASTMPVLIEGPTGTGKEVLARFIHNSGSRNQGPFIAINCAAMPESMLEAMLFGHRKGAFTGASEAAEGFFRAADGGTLLLDEIGEMPLGLQAKLLRALQEGEVVPIGATRPIRIDVRIIASTNRNLAQEVAAGRFREDLFYRLNVFPLTVPALRDRQGDLAPLAFAMLLRHAREGEGPGWISASALHKLAMHSWPGNARELENVIRRAMLLAGNADTINAQHICFDAAVRTFTQSGQDRDAQPLIGRVSGAKHASLADIAFRSQATAIADALAECRGHRANAAARLGISERTLRYRLANMRSAGLAAVGAR